MPSRQNRFDNFPVTFWQRILSLKQVNDYASRFWELLECEHQRARTYCLRLVGNTDDGDDVYQDAIMKAYRGFAALRDTAVFRPWLYRIINNTYRDRFASPWWRRVLTGIYDLESAAGCEDPSHQYDARRRVAYALDALSAEERTLVTLAELEGWKIAELAELLGKSEAVIKMRLSRARGKMRERLLKLGRKRGVSLMNGEMEQLCCATKPEKD